MSLLTLFWLMLKASLFSSGGFGNIPSLSADLIGRGWATPGQFADAMAVGSVAPGPNGLWVVSLGYFIGGGKGAVLALLAILMPPLLVIGVSRIYRRVQDHPAIEGFLRGLSLAVIGIFTTVLFGLLRVAGLSVRSLLIALVSLGLGATGRIPVFVILLLAALAGLLSS